MTPTTIPRLRLPSLRDVTLLAGIFLLGAGAAWLWRIGSPGPAEVETDAPGASSASRTADPAEMVPSSARAAAGAHERMNVAEPPHVERDRTPRTALWQVRVLERGTQIPIAGARVVCLPSSTGYDARFAALDVRTGAGGEADLEVPAETALRLWVVAGPQAGNALQALEGLSPGQRAERVVELDTTRDQDFFGRVCAADSERAIVAARVRLFDGSPIPNAALARADRPVLIEELATDDKGRFEIAIPGWKSVTLRVDAEGYGPLVMRPPGSHDAPERAAELRLTRGAVLVVRVEGPNTAREAAELSLSTEAARGVRSSAPGLEWSQPLPASGELVFTDLASGTPLRARVRRGADLVFEVPDPLLLSPGERREVVWSLASGARLSGTLLGAAGEPLAGLDLWLVRASGAVSGDRYLTERDSPPHASARSDVRGAFSFEDVVAGSWWLGPAARRFAESAPHAELSDLASTRAIAISIAPGSAEQSVVLRVERGLFLAGSVLDPEGEPQAHARVRAAALGDAQGQLSASTDPEGRFRIGPLSSGRFSLVAEGAEGACESEPLEAAAGAGELVLRLRQGASLSGRIVAAKSGEPLAAKVLISPAGPEPRPIVCWAGRDARFEVRGLRPGQYDLVATTADGRVGRVTRLEARAGNHIGDLLVECAPGGALRLQYRGPAAWAHFDVLAEGVVVAREALAAGGSARFTVPAGDLVVRRSIEGGATEERKVTIASGAELEIEFYQE